MVDSKVDMSSDGDSYNSLTTNDPKNVQELTQYVSVPVFWRILLIMLLSQVQSLLQTIQDKFQNMSDQILTRIDEMGNRIDDLEKNIGDLMTQAGVEGSEKQELPKTISIY